MRRVPLGPRIGASAPEEVEMQPKNMVSTLITALAIGATVSVAELAGGTLAGSDDPAGPEWGAAGVDGYSVHISAATRAQAARLLSSDRGTLLSATGRSAL